MATEEPEDPKMKEFFDSIGTDGSGKANWKELEAAVRAEKLKELGLNDVNDLVLEVMDMDGNRDGEVSYEEWKEWVNNIVAGKEKVDDASSPAAQSNEDAIAEHNEALLERANSGDGSAGQQTASALVAANAKPDGDTDAKPNGDTDAKPDGDTDAKPDGDTSAEPEEKEEPLVETKPGDRSAWNVDSDDAKQAKGVADSNMDGHGGKEHREMRQKAAESEVAWKGAGDKLGVKIWRVEKFKIQHWPEDKYGHFYAGDSYIILNTYQEEADGPHKYNAHFWLGSDTTQDEAGTAAYKTVELDDLLGDEPVQYREVHGQESKHFTNLFDRMHIMEGGVESGFNHVKPTEYMPRLLHVKGDKNKKGKRNMHVVQVPLSADNLNDGDTFILDAGLEVYQWNGKTANVWEKRKGMVVLEEIVESRNGKVQKKQVIDHLEKCDDFWKFFGGRPDKITPTVVKEPAPAEKVITRVCDASGKVEFTEVSRGKIAYSDLDTMDAFIVDVGLSVYVWIGAGCTKKEKREAMRYAVTHLNQQGRGTSVPICRVIEGKEPQHFREQFDA